MEPQGKDSESHQLTVLRPSRRRRCPFGSQMEKWRLSPFGVRRSHPRLSASSIRDCPPGPVALNCGRCARPRSRACAPRESRPFGPRFRCIRKHSLL